MKKRILATVICLCLVGVSSLTALAANEKMDKAEQSAFDRFVDAGLVQSGTMEQQVTRAGFAALVNKVIDQLAMSASISKFTDISTNDAYHADLAKALSAGYMMGTSATTMSPTAITTREQAATMIARIGGVKTAEVDIAILAAYADADEVSVWSAPSVAAMLKSGAMSTINGELAPKAPVTYGEVVYMLDAVVNNILPNGQIMIAGTIYHYGKTAAIDINGTAVQGKQIGSSGVYYAPEGTALSGTLYGEKDMTFAEFWYGELNTVTNLTSAQSKEYLNYGVSEKTEDIYAGQQKETWDNDSGMYDAITRATVGYGIYRAAFIHNVELTRDDGTKELYSHEIYRDADAPAGFSVDLNTTNTLGIGMTANTRLDAKATTNYTPNTKLTFDESVAAGGGGYTILGIRYVPVSVDAVKLVEALIANASGAQTTINKDFLAAVEGIGNLSGTSAYGTKALYDGGVFGARDTKIARADNALSGEVFLGDGNDGTKEVAHGDGYADLTMYIYMSDFEKYTKGSIATLDETTLDTLYASKESTFAKNEEAGLAVAAFMDYALNFYGAKLQWAGADGIFDTADDMSVGNMLHKDAYYSFNHGHYIEVSITKSFERFYGLGDGHYRITLMSDGYEDVMVEARDLVLDFAAPILTDEDVPALGNANSFSVEVDATSINVSKDTAVTKAFTDALAKTSTYKLVISKDISVVPAKVEMTSAGKYKLTFELDAAAKAALANNTQYQLTVTSGVKDVQDTPLSIHYAPED